MSALPPLASTPVTSGAPWSRAAEGAAIVGFWAFLAALEFFRRTMDPFGRGAGVDAVVYVSVASYAVWALLTPLIFALARRFPLEREAIARRLVVHAAIGLAVAVGIEALKITLIQTLTGPADFPARPRPPSPTAALYRFLFLDELVTYLVVLAVGFARGYFIRLREREREAVQLHAEAARLEAQLADARLAALRMQLNPHFLFNTLNSVSSLADVDPEGVQRIVARLSALLRRALEGTARQEVPLSEELSFLRDYLEIQRVRFQGRLEVTEEVEPGALDALVPNLILQPLVENAVEHGGRENEAVRIVLSAQRAEDALRLILTVRDNGPGLREGAQEAAERRGRVGLANTRARLEALYGADAALDLTEAPDGGLVATVSLPYHTAADLRTAAHA